MMMCFVRGLLEFVDQHGFASLQSFGDFRMQRAGLDSALRYRR